MGTWHRDRAAWRFVGRYAAWLAGLQLVWEVAQLPLYTLWREAAWPSIAFAVAHCTAGDVLIGVAALLLSALLSRQGDYAAWRWRTLLAWLLLLAPAYTLFSEWLNTTLFRWRYSELMPMLSLGGLRIGLSPLLQWLVVPPLAIHFARR